MDPVGKCNRLNHASLDQKLIKLPSANERQDQNCGKHIVDYHQLIEKICLIWGLSQTCCEWGCQAQVVLNNVGEKGEAVIIPVSGMTSRCLITTSWLKICLALEEAI